MELKKVTDKRERYLRFLILADESAEVVNEYLNLGELYEILAENQTVGVVLFIPEDEQVIELKNIALVPEVRGKGIGKKVISESARLLSELGYKTLTVGTANSSIENLAFYQKAGFRISGIQKDFFLKYPKPIIENGIRALDMIMFEMKL